MALGSYDSETPDPQTQLVSNRVVSLETDTPKEVISKTISYVAEGTVANRVMLISPTQSATAVASVNPSLLRILNDGRVPVIVLLGYETYTDINTDGPVKFLQSMLMPGDQMIPPLRGFIPITDGDDGQVYDGTSVAFTEATMTTDSATDVNDADVAAEDTSFTVDEGGHFRVGDFIQLGTTPATTATLIEIMEVTAISTHLLTVKRGLFGTVVGEKDNQTTGHVNNANVLFPFFNEYMGVYNYDTATSALYSKPTTDGQGRFKARNLQGIGRTTGATVFGITPGSVMIQFADAGYVDITQDGDITFNTDSGLTAGLTYFFTINIDNLGADATTFTVGTSTKFMGSGGVVQKLQESLDLLSATFGKNSYKKKAKVEVIGGNLRITSCQHAVGTSSSIVLSTNTAGTSGTDELFDGTNGFGRIPADVPYNTVGALPDSPSFDNITNESTPNLSNIIYDDGQGVLLKSKDQPIGEINYETGALDFKCEYLLSQFSVAAFHSSIFSGARDATDAVRTNSLTEVKATVHNSRATGSLKLEVY